MGPLARATAGLLSVVLISALGYAGTRIAMGALNDVHTFSVVFGETGQGLIAGSDVKVRGVRVGTVGKIELDDQLRAVAEINLDPKYELPERSTFVVTNKTLLGEKQVEVTFPGSIDNGPYIAQGELIDDPDRIVEFENVLGTLATLMEAIDEEDLMVVIDDGLGAFDGQGAEIARSVDEGARAAETFSRSLDDQEANNRNLSLVAEELGQNGDTFNRLGRSANRGLPTISQNQVEIRNLLNRLSRFSESLDATFTVNRDDIDRMIVEGDNVTRLLATYDVELGQVMSGLVGYTEKFGPGFQHPSFPGQAAQFQILLTQEAVLAELCILPKPIRDAIEECAKQPKDDPGGVLPPLPDGLPDIPDEIPDEIPDLPLPASGNPAATDVPTRQEIDAMMNRSLRLGEDES